MSESKTAREWVVIKLKNRKRAALNLADKAVQIRLDWLREADLTQKEIDDLEGNCHECHMQCGRGVYGCAAI